MYTVGGLIEELQQFDESTEVRVASQPSYPLANEIQNVCNLVEGDEDGFVWIAVDQISSYQESPYAPRDVWF
jgi:hypothetical protein